VELVTTAIMELPGSWRTTPSSRKPEITNPRVPAGKGPASIAEWPAILGATQALKGSLRPAASGGRAGEVVVGGSAPASLLPPSPEVFPVGPSGGGLWMTLAGGRGVGVFTLLIGSGLLIGFGPARPPAGGGILGAIVFCGSVPSPLSGAFPVDLAANPDGGCLVITLEDGDEVWGFVLPVADALPLGVCPAPTYVIATDSGIQRAGRTLVIPAKAGIHRADALPENTGEVDSRLRGSDGEATAVRPSAHTERKNTRTPRVAPLG